MKALLIEPKSNGLLLAVLAIISFILVMGVFGKGGEYSAFFSCFPFALLSISSFFVKGNIQHYGFFGAAVGAIIANSFPFIYLVYTSVSYEGGGANLGVGFAFMFLPIYSAVASIFGWLFGKSRPINAISA